MKARGPRDERPVHNTHSGEREPQDPMTGAPATPADGWPTDAVPVRHLAHRILEALS